MTSQRSLPLPWGKNVLFVLEEKYVSSAHIPLSTVKSVEYMKKSSRRDIEVERIDSSLACLVSYWQFFVWLVKFLIQNDKIFILINTHISFRYYTFSVSTETVFGEQKKGLASW